MEKIGLDMRIAALVSLTLLSLVLFLWLGFEHDDFQFVSDGVFEL